MSPVAYLVSDYHAPSHTFVRREVAALRALGLDIFPFSIRRRQASDGDVQNIVGRPLLDYLAAVAWALFMAPARFAASWWLAARHRGPGVKALLWSQFHFVEAMMLARLLSRAGATRLHNHFANSGATVGLIASSFLRIPWSLTLHGISETDYPAGLLLAQKLERAAFVACASYFMRAQAMRVVAPSHWSKMTIVRCGIHMSALPEPQPYSSQGPARLICVGRLSAEKGYSGLLDALAALASKDRVGFDLVIVGAGPLADDLSGQATALGLGDRIRFVGALPEAQTLAEIARADILVLPSLIEGLPVVLIEAMAMRRPVLASRVAGIPELVEEGRTGFMFPPSDWEALSEAIEALISARNDWPRLGHAARARVETEFHVDRSASRMACLFAGECPP